MRQTVHNGFTLLEVLMVVALLGVVAAFMWPEFHNVATAEHVKESARRLQALVSMCRAEAMNETRTYRIRTRPDGSVRVLCQADALKAPHLYITPPVGWARQQILLSDVWVEGVQLLPEGPPPIRIIDEQLEFPEVEIKPVPVVELPAALDLDFAPDGTCNSLRWVLRDERGSGLLVTLDGRFGRVKIEDWTAVPEGEIRRPEALPEEDEVEYNPESYK